MADIRTDVSKAVGGEAEARNAGLDLETMCSQPCQVRRDDLSRGRR